jgi:molybdopterin-guanine dinucleotide biosynthesis protein A
VTTREGVVGAVLAGGAGTRLGGAKPGVPLAGRPLLSYPLAALRGALAEVAVVAKEDTALPAVGYGVLIWREPAEPRHPLTGIVEALRRAEGRPVVVLACDLPFVTADLVRTLAAADAGGAPAVVATTPERGLQPLCARYEPAALELLAGFDPSGRTIAQIQALNPATLSVAEVQLRNVNSPEDLAAAEAALA